MPTIGGMATWAVVKAQARDILGINLTDADVDQRPAAGNRPLRQLHQGAERLPAGGDPDRQRRGRHRRHADDMTTLVEGNPPRTDQHLTNAVRTGHQFLADIAFNAEPVSMRKATSFRTPMPTGNAVAFDPPTGRNLEYDDELLDAHYIAGDGRVNENIGLTAVHSIFHSEHNRLVDQTKDTASLRAAGDMAFLNEWLLTPVAACRHDLAIRPAMERRAAVPGGEVRHRDAVPASRVRGVRAHHPAAMSTCSSRRLRCTTPTSTHRSSPSSRTPSTASAIRC